jgi:thioredoxin-related protein
LAAVLACAFSTARAADLDWQSDLDAAWQQSRQEQRPLLVFLTTSGCRYCTLMQTTTFTDPGVAELIERGFVPAAVDAKNAAWLVKSQKVGTFPTTLVISSEAQVIDRINGYVKPADLKPRLAKTAASGRTASKPAAKQ